MAKPPLAIIGFGDFTKLMVEHLSPHFDILVASRQKITNKSGLNFEHVDLKTALGQPIIIPSMPSQFLETFFTENKSLINPNALVVDVCSVKVKPVEVLQKVLPATTQILATHPMFGPASAKHGLQGQRVMIYPVRLPAPKYRRITRFLKETLGLQVIEATPEEHDRIMAYAQGLSHYIGRSMQIMDIPKSQLTTKAYDDLLDMKRVQGNDSEELFDSIMFANPYALEVNTKFKQTMKDLDEQIGIK